MATFSRTEQRRLNYPIIIWMVVIHMLLLLAPFTFSWGGFAVFLVLYFLTACLGVTFGFHRLLTHRSLKAPRWLERSLATLGTLALQGGPLLWVAHHRMHHSRSDSQGDPHNSRLGFWHSHMGWMLQRSPDFEEFLYLRKFARDACADPYLLWLSKPPVQISLQVAVGLALLAVGGWSYAIWGIFVRLVAVYHVTALLAFGEGWHNNHHAEPSAVHVSRSWWELDVTWMFIKLLSFLGIVYDLRMPERGPRG